MLCRFRYLAYLAILTCGSLRASAQFPLADEVCTGTRKSYWVDSTANQAYAYIWSVDGKVVQSGSTCMLTYTWDTEGVFNLGIRQISAVGCVGNLQTCQVIVNPVTSGISIFPNPISGSEINFQIYLPESDVVTVDLFMPDGQKVCRVFEGPVPEKTARTITYRHLLHQGIYVYQIKTGKLNINGKVIVIRVY